MEGPVKVYVGTDSQMEKSDIALQYSLQKNSSVPVEIVWMNQANGGLWGDWDIGREKGRPYSSQGWATDFSCFRFAIPEANKFKGRAIYLDTDMIVLKDIKALFDFPMDRPVMVTPRRYDVILFDCAAFKDLPWWPSIKEMKKNKMMVKDYQQLLYDHDMVSSGLPIEWNCCDGDGYVPGQTALVHYTEMRTQPWKPYPNIFEYPEHPRPDMVELFWKTYEEAVKSSGPKMKKKSK